MVRKDRADAVGLGAYPRLPALTSTNARRFRATARRAAARPRTTRRECIPAAWLPRRLPRGAYRSSPAWHSSGASRRATRRSCSPMEGGGTGTPSSSWASRVGRLTLVKCEGQPFTAVRRRRASQRVGRARAGTCRSLRTTPSAPWVCSSFQGLPGPARPTALVTCLRRAMEDDRVARALDPDEFFCSQEVGAPRRVRVGLAVPVGQPRVRQVRLVLEPQRVPIIVRLEEDVLHYFQAARGHPTGERPADGPINFPAGLHCGHAATPALHPQMDKNVRTGGSLYLAM